MKEIKQLKKEMLETPSMNNIAEITYRRRLSDQNNHLKEIKAFQRKPKKYLEGKLANEPPNSPVIKALIDKISIELALDNPYSTKRPRKSFRQASKERAQVENRIKVREHAKWGTEYRTAYLHGDVLFDPYYLGHKEKWKVEGDIYYRELRERILFDLTDINNKKIRQEARSMSDQ
jgi:hypothetical protein